MMSSFNDSEPAPTRKQEVPDDFSATPIDPYLRLARLMGLPATVPVKAMSVGVVLSRQLLPPVRVPRSTDVAGRPAPDGMAIRTAVSFRIRQRSAKPC